MRWGGARESGAGALLAVAVIGALLLLTGVLVPLLGAVVLESRARGAADAGALAAADAVSGRSTGVPCERAADLVARHGAVVTACTLDGADVVVDVAIDAGWLTVAASARAGPPRLRGGVASL